MTWAQRFCENYRGWDVSRAVYQRAEVAADPDAVAWDAVATTLSGVGFRQLVPADRLGQHARRTLCRLTLRGHSRG